MPNLTRQVMMKCIIIVLISALTPFMAMAQVDSTELDSLSALFSEEEVPLREKWGIKPASNEVGFVFNSAFYFYKAFISSQDDNVCAFSPSCSVYAIRSIQGRGALAGILSAFDRLSRCNGLSPEKYPKTKEGLLYDPVK